jgi:hypothetical protein
MKKLLTIILTFTVVLAFSQQRVGSKKTYPGPSLNPTISVTGLGSGGLTPNSLVAALVGPGVTYSNVSFTGIQGGTSTASAGIFSAGQTIFGFDDGVVLSSGTAVNSLGPNNFYNTTTMNGLGSDPDLAAVFGGPLYDACVLEFDFVPNANQMYVQYVFGSEEYNEYVNDLFIDCFAFFLDGTNIAFVPGTATPVSINSVNLGVNSASYRNNELGTGTGHIPGPYDIECDGFTIPFTATATLTPNVPHHIKLVIADKYDDQWDSWVFLNGASFSTTNPDIPTLSEWGLIILGLALLALGTVYILKMRG